MNVGRAGCPVEVYAGAHGHPRACDGEPSHSAVIRWKLRRVWVRVYPCARHAADVPGAEPMSGAHRALLAERRRQVGLALAGRAWVPTPTSTDRTAV